MTTRADFVEHVCQVAMQRYSIFIAVKLEDIPRGGWFEVQRCHKTEEREGETVRWGYVPHDRWLTRINLDRANEIQEIPAWHEYRERKTRPAKRRWRPWS